jgi:predicted PurR-regulated permease PerM
MLRWNASLAIALLFALFLWLLRPELGPWSLGAILLLLLFPHRRREEGALLFKAVLLLLLLLLLKAAGGILTAMSLAVLFSYVLAPLMRAPGLKKMPSALSALIIVATLVGILSTILIFVAPLVVAQMLRLAEQIPQLVNQFSTFLHRDLEGLLARHGLDLPAITRFLNTELPDHFSTFMSQFTGVLTVVSTTMGTVAGKIMNLLLTPILTYYFLVNQEALEKEIALVTSPQTRERYHRYVRELNRIISGYLRGQLLVSTIIALLIWIGLTIIGFEYALLMGIVTGIAYVVPYVGAAFSFLTTAVIAFFSGMGWVGLFQVALVYGVVATLESVLITPKIMGGSVGLNPILVILGIFLFGSLFGLPGVMFAVPLTAIALFVYRQVTGTPSSRGEKGEDHEA